LLTAKLSAVPRIVMGSNDFYFAEIDKTEKKSFPYQVLTQVSRKSIDERCAHFITPTIAKLKEF